MKNHGEFEGKIKRSLNAMDAKISFLHEGVKGLGQAFKEFQEDITEFMAFTAENYTDHEKCLTALEKRIK